MTISPRDRRTVEWLSKELIEQKKQIKALQNKPRLAYSSIENGAIEEYDAGGQLVSIIGKQYDGTHGVVEVASPAPPTPYRAYIIPGVESLTVGWAGTFAGADGEEDLMIVAPLNHDYIEVHVSQDPAFSAVFSDTLRATIYGARGSEAVISPLPAEPHYIRLVARNKAGKPSEPSWVVSGTPLAMPDPTLTEIDAAEVVIKNAAQMFLDDATGDQPKTVGGAIDDAAASPVTDERLQAGSLTVWPFQDKTVPEGALAPGAVKQDDIADFAIAVKKINSNRHMLY